MVHDVVITQVLPMWEHAEAAADSGVDSGLFFY